MGDECDRGHHGCRVAASWSTGVPRHLDDAPSRIFTLIDTANDRHDATLYAWPSGECRWYLHHSDDHADALIELREGLEVLRRSVDEWLRSA